MKNKILKTAILGFVGLSLASCATILSGKTQKINVSSVGEKNVKFEIDGQTYKTPAIITVERENKDKIIKVLDDKCSQKQILLNKKINPVFFVNILSGGVLGSTIDYVTNAMWEYDSNVQIDCR